MHQESDHPTLLTMPGWEWPGPSVVVLPLPATEYDLQEVQPDWFEVRERRGRTLIWSGIGPASITASNAPF